MVDEMTINIYQDVNDVDGRRHLPHSASFDDNAAVIQIAAPQTTIVIILLLLS